MGIVILIYIVMKIIGFIAKFSYLDNIAKQNDILRKNINTLAEKLNIDLYDKEEMNKAIKSLMLEEGAEKAIKSFMKKTGADYDEAKQYVEGL